MKNPFDEKTEKEKHEFFKQMTSAINDWMLAQYPQFDSMLVKKIEHLSKMQNEIKMCFMEREVELNAIKERHLNYITGQINEFLKKDYPDISNSLSRSAKELEKAVKRHEENTVKIKKKLDEVVKSESVYEDVYKLRDEFKIIQKFFDGFQKKIKKAFEV